jgi:hypothetical protein
VTRRLRIFLDHPLDRRSRLAVLGVAAAVTVGFAALVALSGTAGSRPGQEPGPTTPVPRPAASRRPVRDHPRRRPHPRQDPQDRPGSTAARRARHELASHRALQHVPYRRGGVLVTLAGARGGRAVLRVEAASLAAARRGWRRFLRRFHDSGGAYLPAFRTEAGRRG